MYYKFERYSSTSKYTLKLSNTQEDEDYQLYTGNFGELSGSCNGISGRNVILPADCSHMFEGFAIEYTPSGLDFSQVEDASYMFKDCGDLTTVAADDFN